MSRITKPPFKKPLFWIANRCGFLLNGREMTPLAAIVLLIIFSGASFFFALAETSLFSLGKWQARQLIENSPILGKIVNRLFAEPQDLLATLVLGNSFANAGIVGVVLWMTVHRGWPFALVLPGLLVLILFGGEVAPKTLAVRAPELWALRIARPMLFLQKISRPLRRGAQALISLILRLLNLATPQAQGLSDAEYQELLEMACQQGALAAGEKEIILQIISLDQRRAGDVMRGRSQMVCVPDDSPVEEWVAAARRFKHRRIPIYDGTPETIVGVLNTRALLFEPEGDVSAAIELPSFVPETMNLLLLWKSLQRSQRGMAIVLDEFGGTAGIVTIEDILAEILGELGGQRPQKYAVLEKMDGNRWRVGGGVSLDNFRREYPQLPEVPGVETMAGLVLNRLEVVPSVGESTTLGGLRLTVKAADERRIRELLVEVVRKR